MLKIQMYFIIYEEKYLRHWDDHEIQPVPWVSEKGEPIYSESSGDHFSEWLKRVDTCEGIPWEQREKRVKRRQTH